MDEQVLYLNDYEIMVFDRVISTVLENSGVVDFSNEKGAMMYVAKNVVIPTNSRIQARFSDGATFEFNLSESSEREFSFYNKKYKLAIRPIENVNGHYKTLLSNLRETFQNTMPDTFVSLEHFLFYLEDYTRINVGSFNITLLSAAERALMKIFDNWEKIGTVTSLENPGLSPNCLRIEVRDGEYRYIDVNRFTVYRKDKMTIAVGITVMETPFSGQKRYLCAIFCKNTESHVMEKTFGKQFEQFLLADRELKGGKFTGDFQIIKLNTKLSMDDIVLENNIREKIEREIFGFFALQPLYQKAGLPFKRGIALYGPTGTGKTMIAKIIASQMKETVIWVKAGDITSTDDINRIFRMARLGAPSVVILEDIDFYTTDRNNIDANKVGVATMMANLDGLEENEGILVIVTTNRLDVIEKAIIDRPGRIDTRIFMGELGKNCIVQLLEKKLGSFKKEFDSFADVIPENTVMPGANVVELSSSILRNALKREQSGELVLSKNDVIKALKEMQRIENKAQAGFLK